MDALIESKWRWKLLDKSIEELIASRDALIGAPNRTDLLMLIKDELWVRKIMGLRNEK